MAKMRHQKIKSKLNRTTAHRKALMRNLASSLIRDERIQTTVAKAKNLRPFIERLITLGKKGDLASRRLAFNRLGKKEAVHKLFEEVAPRFSDRPGGYTRILKTGTRIGDAADMCIIELVDFNTTYVKETAKPAAKKTRRAGSKAKKAETGSANVVAEEPKSENQDSENATSTDEKAE